MSNTVRTIIALVGAAVLAALAVPELSSRLPAGVAPALAAAIAAVLQQTKPLGAPPAPPANPEGQ